MGIPNIGKQVESIATARISTQQKAGVSAATRNVSVLKMIATATMSVHEDAQPPAKPPAQQPSSREVRARDDGAHVPRPVGSASIPAIKAAKKARPMALGNTNTMGSARLSGADPARPGFTRWPVAQSRVARCSSNNAVSTTVVECDTPSGAVSAGVTSASHNEAAKSSINFTVPDPNCGRCDPFKAPNINVIKITSTNPCARKQHSKSKSATRLASRVAPSCEDVDIVSLCAAERLGICKPPRPVGFNSAINSGVLAVVGGNY